MQKINKKITPKFITELSRCERFVFGSNLAGHHGGGAARIAYEKFGAEWGNGVGPQGQSYAIPTMQGPVETIKPYADEFIEYAKGHPMERFLLTRVGCGIAGFTDKEIAPLFAEALDIPNISIPEEWLPIMVACPHRINRKDVITPKVVDEFVLRKYCEEYKYVIGSGVQAPMPKIRIRYVSSDGLMRFASFGDFFFLGQQLFVFDYDEMWAPEHNEGVLLDCFWDECKGRGYAHPVTFAGVWTGLQDAKGEYIYTGDVCNIVRGGSPYRLAISAFRPEEDCGCYVRGRIRCDRGRILYFESRKIYKRRICSRYNIGDPVLCYALLLDNYHLTPIECDSVTIDGNVFDIDQELDWPKPLSERCKEFNMML